MGATRFTRVGQIGFPVFDYIGKYLDDLDHDLDISEQINPIYTDVQSGRSIVDRVCRMGSTRTIRLLRTCLGGWGSV